MLTKAFVTDVYSPHSARIRMPLLNKIDRVQGATPNDELSIAAVCTVPNFITDLHQGDVVVIGFEEDDFARPIILGYLSTPSVSSTVDIKCGDFTSTGKVVLSKDVTIDKVGPQNIKSLENQTDNISHTFTTIKTDVKTLQDKVKANSDTLTPLVTDVGTLQSDVAVLSSTVESLKGEIVKLKAMFDDYLKKYPTILAEGSYGNDVSKVTGATPGQIYLSILEDE